MWSRSRTRLTPPATPTLRPVPLFATSEDYSLSPT